MHRNQTSQVWIIPVLSGAAFFYFLIFAQFGYLHLLTARTELAKSVDLILLFMGLGGVFGSIFCARNFRLKSATLWILSGFSGAGILSVLAAFVTELWIHWIIGFMIGTCLSLLTVSIVPVIRDRSPDGKIGKWVSMGVGGAYFLCNIPIIFQAGPIEQCIIGAVACCIGALASIFISRIDAIGKRSPKRQDVTPKYFFNVKGIIVITLLFTVLVWFDSAAFYLIQNADIIRSTAWESTGNIWLNAVTHLLAALVCGWVIDRGWIFESLIGAIILIIGGYGIIHSSDHGIIPGILVYIASVSTYSTALVSYGALAPDGTGAMRIAGRSALVFAVAGWIGSGMGIGMARDLGRIPYFFIVVMIAIGITCLMYGARNRIIGEK